MHENSVLKSQQYGRASRRGAIPMALLIGVLEAPQRKRLAV